MGDKMRKKIFIITTIIAVSLIIIGILLSFNKRENELEEKAPTPSVDKDIEALNKVNNLEIFFIKYIPIEDINSISNQMKLNFIASLSSVSQNETIKASYFSKELKNYFGSSFSFKNEDIMDLDTNEEIMSYNEKKGEYSYIKNTDDNNIHFLSSSEIEETSDGLNIYRQYLFVDTSSSEHQIYSSYQDCLNKINSIGAYDLDSTNGILSSSIITEYKNILPVITYSFVKENKRYVLKSII